MSTENFMGRVEIERSSEAAITEPYVALAQLDCEAWDNISTVRIPVSLIGKLIEQLQAHLVKVAT